MRVQLERAAETLNTSRCTNLLRVPAARANAALAETAFWTLPGTRLLQRTPTIPTVDPRNKPHGRCTTATPPKRRLPEDQQSLRSASYAASYCPVLLAEHEPD